MALENNEEAAERPNPSKKKKKSKEEEEEDLLHEILIDSLHRIRSDLERLDKAIDFNEDNPRKLSILLNTKARTQQQLFYCVALMRDPKLRLTSESGRMKDFAKRIEKSLLDENPASAKLVQATETAQDSKNSPSSSNTKKDSPNSPDHQKST